MIWREWPKTNLDRLVQFLQSAVDISKSWVGSAWVHHYHSQNTPSEWVPLFQPRNLLANLTLSESLQPANITPNTGFIMFLLCTRPLKRNLT